MKISACLITKNEEKNVQICLKSLQPIVDEIIVVDTGSTDQTVAVVSAFGAKVFQYQWQEDFAAARNYALSKAHGQWIIFLDADEYFTPESLPVIPGAIQRAEQLKCDVIVGFMTNVDPKTNSPLNSSEKIRIFRKHPDIRYEGTIHERLIHRKKQLKPLYELDTIKLIHTGYSSEVMEQKRKAERNLALLYKELKHKPQDSSVHFYISEALKLIEKYAESIAHAQKAAEYHNSNLAGIYEKNYVNMLDCMQKLQYSRGEIIATLKKAIAEHPGFPDFYFHLGNYYFQDYRYTDAIDSYQLGLRNLENLAASQSKAHLMLTDTLYLLGELYSRTGQLPKSVSTFVEVLKLDKYYYPAIEGLIRLLSKHEKPEAIYGFLAKIYDYQSLKDLYLLLKSVLRVRNISLVDQYLASLQNLGKMDVWAESAEAALLKDNAATAHAIYREHITAIQPSDESHIKSLLAACLARQLNSVEKPAQDASLARYYDYLLGARGQLLPDDSSAILPVLACTIELGRLEFLEDQREMITQLGLAFQVAEKLYTQEYFDQAYHYYQDCLRAGVEPATKLEVTIKSADCLRKTGEYEQALINYEEARLLAPADFRIYTGLAEIYRLLNQRDKMEEIAKQARLYFLDTKDFN